MSGCKKIIIFIVVVSFLVIPIGSSALAKGIHVPPERTPLLMLADGVVVRPVQFSSLVLGTVSFVVTLPWSALGGNIKEAYTKMMVEPCRQTFKRPLGGF
jgi:hypothetical protein